MKVNFVESLVTELIDHEGYINGVYADSLGFKTLGIGHLVTNRDDEYFKEVGSFVDDWTVAAYFFNDVSRKMADTKAMFPDIKDYPEDVQRVLLNMMFNLGYTKLAKFKRMRKAVERRDWNRAADEMMDSRWYKQVKSRGVELVSIMRSVA